LEEATDAFHGLGAGVLEAWSRALLSLSLARAGAPEAREAALQAENLARYSGTPGARYFPYLALAEIEPDRAAEYGELAAAVQEESGLAPLSPAAPVAAPENVIRMGMVRPTASLSIRCFGGFTIAIKGRAVDLTAVKPRAAIAHFEQALELYAGELLPEDGPAEWAIEPRERFHAGALEAAQGLAELLLKRGDPAAAASACSTGLWIDRLHDPLWKLLIQARERAGDPVAASRARRAYARVLEGRGFTPT